MKGRITKLIAGQYTIYCTETSQFYDCKPLGVFRHKELKPKVGDLVEFEKSVITKIEKRTNDLIRPAICNIDQALVVTSVKEPNLNLNLLDRFLVILEHHHITPFLIFSKWDLLTENEKITAQEIVEYYHQIGYETLVTSNEKINLSEINDILKGKISFITGESGVGKSSLLNSLDSTLDIKTNEISVALNRGKHTTRHVELIPINDGWIADTPGFGNLSLEEIELAELPSLFIEFAEFKEKCKFSSCLHHNEKICGVKQAVEQNLIKKERYNNYLSFLNEIKNNRKW